MNEDTIVRFSASGRTITLVSGEVNREFRVFLRKILEIIKKIYSHPKKDVAVTETRLLTHKTRKSV